jgi:hypothetical protein
VFALACLARVLTVLQLFRSYQLPLDGITEDGLNWMATMWEDPVIVAQSHDYFEQAKDPKTFVEHYEDIFKGNPEIRYGQFHEDWKFMPEAVEYTIWTGPRVRPWNLSHLLSLLTPV